MAGCQSLSGLKAMILAAGRGTRLRPLTEQIPKCMVRVAGKPVLEHTVEWLLGFGVKEMVINLHYLPQVVVSYFGDGSKWGASITYSIEQELLGTAGGVKNVGWFFDGPFLLWYGDNMSTCKLDRLYEFHRAKGGIATIALHYRQDPTTSGIAGLDENERITRFLEKPRSNEVFSNWVCAGIYVLEPSVLGHIPAGGAPDFGRHVLPAMLADGQPLFGYRMQPDEELWWIDTVEDLQRVEENRAR